MATITILNHTITTANAQLVALASDLAELEAQLVREGAAAGAVLRCYARGLIEAWSAPERAAALQDGHRACCALGDLIQGQ